jgi:uncharacterized membrane protein YhaH (DUF805 family)
MSSSCYHRYTDANLSFVRAVAGIQTIILVITMAFRRTPVRVTPNPWYWLLAFVATYGLIAFYAFAAVPTGLCVIQSMLAYSSRCSRSCCEHICPLICFS